MFQQDTYAIPLHFPGHSLPQVRNHDQASSDPTPASQTAPSQIQNQNSCEQEQGFEPTDIIENGNQKSDPFYRDSHSIPYWDDSNGIIYEIPSDPPRRRNRPEAQPFYGWHNPYAEIVGGGPYAQQSAANDGTAIVQDMPYAYKKDYDKKVASQHDPPAENPVIRESKDSRFRLCLGMLYIWRHEGVVSSTTDRFRRSVGKQDANQKLHQGATATIQASTAKCGGKRNEAPGPLAYANTTKLSFKKESHPKAPSSPLKSSYRPETQMSPSFPIVKTDPISFFTKQTFVHRSSLIVEEISRPKEFSKKQESMQGIERTPTLDLVCKLRAEEQAKALAMPEGQRLEVEECREYGLDPASSLTHSTTESGIPQVPGNISHDDELHRAKSITGLDFPDESRASSSVYSSDDDDDLDKLAKAVTDLLPFEERPSPSKMGAFPHHSEIAQGLDLHEIQAAEKQQAGVSKSCEKLGRLEDVTTAEAEAGCPDAPSTMDASVRCIGEDRYISAEHSSSESLATLTLEEYDQISDEEKLEVEQSGVNRQWYKVFRRV